MPRQFLSEFEYIIQYSKNRIQKAITENNAREADYFNMTMEMIETHNIIKHLEHINNGNPELKAALDYFKGKELYILCKMSRYDTTTE